MTKKHAETACAGIKIQAVRWGTVSVAESRLTIRRPMIAARIGRKTMSDKLKECPFCGNDESVTIEEYDTPAGDRYRVVCQNCMAVMDKGYCSTAAYAAKAWNRRADE